jgi:hypothetical protein
MKKFSAYGVVVIDLEGKETIIGSKEGRGSNKEMEKLYNDTKDGDLEYQEIRYCGIDEQEIFEIICNKQIVREVVKEPVEVIVEVAKAVEPPQKPESIFPYLEAIMTPHEEIKQRISEIADITSVYSKKVDDLLHHLVAKKDFDTEAKLELFDELRDTLLTRRAKRNELVLCESIQEEMRAYEKMINSINQKMRKFKDYEEGGKRKYSNGKNFVHECDFNDEESLNEAKNKLKGCNKVVVDHAQGKVFGYNKCTTSIK